MTTPYTPSSTSSTSINSQIIPFLDEIFLILQDDETEEIITVMEKNNITVNDVDKNGNTLLHIACRNGNKKIASLLLECNAAINAENRQGSTPLLVACWTGDEDLISLLIDYGANINPNRKGSTPLHLACSHGRLSVVSFLVEHGAKLNVQDMMGFTPLHVACYAYHINVALYLLDQGANPNLPNNNGSYPLHDAVYSCEVVSLMLEKGAMINVQNRDQATPLILASWRNFGDTIKILLVNGADCTLCDQTGRSPLDLLQASQGDCLALMHYYRYRIPWLTFHHHYLAPASSSSSSPSSSSVRHVLHINDLVRYITEYL